MKDQFFMHGKAVTDSGLFPWAQGSIGRALLFYAEAIVSKGNKPLEAIAAYYALFHLSMFTMFTCPQFLPSKDRNRINKGLQEGYKDPSPFIRHEKVLEFLEKCEVEGLSSRVKETFIESKKIREFINYGPRVKYFPDTIFTDSCEISPSRVENVIESLHHVFIDVVEWTCSAGVDGGIWVPILLEEVGDFFNKSNGVYVGWIPENLSSEADKFRMRLLAIAKEKNTIF